MHVDLLILKVSLARRASGGDSVFISTAFASWLNLVRISPLESL